MKKQERVHEEIKLEEPRKENNKEEKKQHEIKEEKKPIERIKRTKVSVNGFDIPVSTKQSKEICRFIKGKKINDAIKDLELVINQRKAVPMRGEIPHRKGRIMSGRFPQKTSKRFIILLKSLSSNCIYNNIENPIITEAFANIGARPFGRRGVRRKRTHIRISAESKKKEERKK